ncbi:MAG TPA: hypothetical protein VHC86_09560 [Opitutaceae bacterium]|nr:hypothetical protein [Opitutaceae bacterium]
MRLADQIGDFVRRLHPDQRRLIKLSLQAMEGGRKLDVRPLNDDLDGFYRLRIGKFRVVFEYLPSGEISCLFIGVRATVYDDFASMAEGIEARRRLEEAIAPYGRPKPRKTYPRRPRSPPRKTVRS